MSNKLGITIAALITAIGLSACDTATDASKSGDTRLVKGVITGFGSVYVNGVEYNTDDADITKDDNSADESELAIGMVVTVDGSVNDDGMTGHAHSISFKDELEGIVTDAAISNGTGSLTVMGQSVTVDADTQFKSKNAAVPTVNDIAAGNIVEVSGFSDGKGNITATYIEVKSDKYTDGMEIEVKGVIANLGGGQFNIGKMTVVYDSGTKLDGITELSDGLYVEVKSTKGLDANGALIASKIELEDGDGNHDSHDGKEGDALEMQGIVTSTDNMPASFELNGQTVIMGDNVRYEHGDASSIVKDAKLEVAGHLNADQQLVADKIEVRKGSSDNDSQDIKGIVESVDTAAKTIKLQGDERVFHVDNQTVMKDGSDAHMQYFNLADLVTGTDYVEIHAYQDDQGNWIATKLERDNHDAHDGSNHK